MRLDASCLALSESYIYLRRERGWDSWLGALIQTSESVMREYKNQLIFPLQQSQATKDMLKLTQLGKGALRNWRNRCYFATSSADIESIPLGLNFPFEYTLAVDQFCFHDVRFTEEPAQRHFSSNQIDHIKYSLGGFQNLLNRKRVEPEIKEKYLHPKLQSKTKDLLHILKDAQIELDFAFKMDSFHKSQGYLQIKPEHSSKAKIEDFEGDMHEHDLRRENDTLYFQPKQKKEQMDLTKKLKEDYQESGSQGKKRQKLDQAYEDQTKSKKIQMETVDKVLNLLSTIGKKQKKSFEKYILVDLVRGTFDCQMLHKGVSYKQSGISFESKWMYLVDHLEADHSNRQRRRVLFDFQYWNRGVLLGVKNFVEGLESDE